MNLSQNCKEGLCEAVVVKAKSKMTQIKEEMSEAVEEFKKKVNDKISKKQTA